MVQFNLLPDVKLEYLKAKRLLRLATSLSVVVGGAMFVIFVVLLLYVHVVQGQQLNSLDNKINTAKVKLGSNQNLNKILTVQNQLDSLPALEAKDPVTSRLFEYLSQITPINADISDFNIDYNQDTMVITGSADSLVTVNQYVDTLKFTTYALSGKDTQNHAFTNVVLASFGVNQNATNGKSASYTINCDFDPTIFDVSQNVKLVVPPNYITTRSITQQPNLKLFVAAPKNSTGGTSG